MKRFLFFLLITSFFCACDDAEMKPTDYPFVITSIPVMDGNEVIFRAQLLNEGGHEIIKYGFVWKLLFSEDNNFELYDGVPGADNFTCKIQKMNNNLVYSVRAYIQTDQLEVYGNEELFFSNY